MNRRLKKSMSLRRGPNYSGFSAAAFVWLLLAAFLIMSPSPASAQLSTGKVSAILSRAAAAGASFQTLYNYGHRLSYQYGPTRENAGHIAEAYKKAKGKNPEQERAIAQAAEYWQKEYENWNQAQTRSRYKLNHNHYYWDYTGGKWKSTLKMVRPRRKLPRTD